MYLQIRLVVDFVIGAGEDVCPGVNFVSDFSGEREEWELGVFVGGLGECEVLEAGA
jgi:hypothetical protein